MRVGSRRVTQLPRSPERSLKITRIRLDTSNCLDGLGSIRFVRYCCRRLQRTGNVSALGLRQHGLMQDGGPSPINDNRTDKIASGWQITRPCHHDRYLTRRLVFRLAARKHRNGLPCLLRDYTDALLLLVRQRVMALFLHAARMADLEGDRFL